MAEPVGGNPVAAHRRNQPGNLPRAAAHQRALERGEPHAVQHARRNADHVLGRRAHFVADQIRSIIKANQTAGKLRNQPFLDRLAARINHHAVGHPGEKFLHMPRPEPHGNVVAAADGLLRNFGKAAERRHLDAFHAQRKRLPAHTLRGDLRHQLRQILRTDGNADQLALERLPQIRRHTHILFQRHQTVGARLTKLLDMLGALSAVQRHLMPDFAQIPRDKRAPAPAADDRCLHQSRSFPFS